MDISLTREGPVALIRWNDGENRINLDSIARLNEIFDELDEVTDPLAVVWTGAGKFFSNGLDLERFAAAPDEMNATVSALHVLFGRILVFPAYTVAAINGHAFAGGAMLSCTTDLRVMRSDRGFWCLNEAELGLPLTDEMAAVVFGRLPATAAREAALTARRFSAADALAAGIVELIAPEEDVLPLAVARAAEVATKDRRVIKVHKRQAFGDIARRVGFDPERSR